jgi:flagellar hook-basal body complex protein FliE
VAIDQIGAASAALPKVAAAASATGASAGNFGDLMGQLLSGLEDGTSQANTAVDAMVNKTGDVHDAMIALQRSELALQLVVQVRNKFVQAYQDIMRMPI